MNKVVFSIILLILFLMLPQVYRNWVFNHDLKASVATSRLLSANPDNFQDSQSGYVKVIGVTPVMEETRLHNFQKK